MTNAPNSGGLSDQSKAILLMIACILFLSLMDATVKGLGDRLDTVQMLWARYTGQTLIVFLIILPALSRHLRTRNPGLHFVRSMVQMGATGFFFFSLEHIGLAEATAIMDIAPMLITLGAAAFLGESLGLRRGLSIGVALLGALIVIRPGSAVFSPWALLPVAGAVCFAAYALLTRFVGPDEGAMTSLFYTGVVGTVVLSALVPFHWVAPGRLDWAMLVLIGCLGAAGQFAMIRALTLAEAGSVAPFTYVGLIFATIWGMVFFGEYPDGWTYVGAAIIGGAGLYIWHRETRVAAPAATIAAAGPADLAVPERPKT